MPGKTRAAESAVSGSFAAALRRHMRQYRTMRKIKQLFAATTEGEQAELNW